MRRHPPCALLDSQPEARLVTLVQRLRMRPHAVGDRISLAICLENLGRRAEARQHWDEALFHLERGRRWTSLEACMLLLAQRQPRLAGLVAPHLGDAYPAERRARLNAALRGLGIAL